MSKTWGEIREEALRRCGQLPPKTNADRIRSMTDEELAELMHDTTWEGRKTVEDPEAFKTIEEWLGWLKKEAQSGNST